MKRAYEVLPQDPSPSGLGADVVLVGDAPAPERRPNPEPASESELVSTSSKRRGKPKAKPKWGVVEDELASIYSGYEHLLVRTAIIRPPNYSPADQPVIRHDEDVEKLCAHLKHADQEHMVVLSLNSQNHVIAIHEVAVGTATGAAFQIRDACKTVILSSGRGVIIVHNHPSGIVRPSEDDLRVTRAVQQGLDCVGISLLDHVIVGRGGRYSFRNEGLL